MALRCELTMMYLGGVLNLLWNLKAVIFGFMVCLLRRLTELPYVAALAIDDIGPANAHTRASPRTGIDSLCIVRSCY
jgi:hypothetical protein